jgi:hypothetical protein
MSEPHPNSHLWPGVPLALASAVLFGATPPLSKLLLNAVSPFVLAGLLYLGAGLGLTIYRFFQGTIGNTGNQAPLRQQDVPWLALNRYRWRPRAGAAHVRPIAHLSL